MRASAHRLSLKDDLRRASPNSVRGSTCFLFLFFFVFLFLANRSPFAFLLQSAPVTSLSARETKNVKGGRKNRVRICRVSGRIARILERQGDGRRGDTSRSAVGERRETADEARERERRSRDLVFLELDEQARTLQSVSARSIFRIRLSRARFVARRPRRLRPR